VKACRPETGLKDSDIAPVFKIKIVHGVAYASIPWTMLPLTSVNL
jgi:hypothetical protein